MFDLV